LNQRLLRLLAGGGLLVALALAVHAQGAAGGGKPPPSGPVTIDYHRGLTYAGNVLRLTGDVSITSAAYELHAEDLRIQLAGGGEKTQGASSIVAATAEGTPDKPVTGRFQQADEGRVIRMSADHAVYRREAGRPDGGRIDFTGHVTMTLLDQAALAGPAVTHSEHMVVLLGQGADYPRVESGPGQATFTPLR